MRHLNVWLWLLSFRPHQGIIQFNKWPDGVDYVWTADCMFPSPLGDYLIQQLEIRVGELVKENHEFPSPPGDYLI